MAVCGVLRRLSAPRRENVVNTGGSINDQPGADAVYRMMESKAEAGSAIDAVLACASSEIRIFDTSPVALRERDFGRPARIEMLKRMLLADRHNRLRIVLHEIQAIESELPRLVSLLGLLPAQILIHRSTAAAREARDVMVIADDAHFWRKPYFEHPRSILTLHDATATQPFAERFEEIWQNSELAVGGGTAGL